MLNINNHQRNVNQKTTQRYHLTVVRMAIIKMTLKKGCLGCRAEKAMAPHSSTLAWEIPWTEEPGGLQSMGSWRVGHDWMTSLSLLCTGEGNGSPLQYSCLENPRDRSLVGCRLWGHTELDTTDVTQQQQDVEKRELTCAVAKNVIQPLLETLQRVLKT